MTWNCVMCGEFVPNDWYDNHCEKCIESLNAELFEAEAGIGTGSCIAGKFGTMEYCRHVVKRSTNVPMGKLRLLA